MTDNSNSNIPAPTQGGTPALTPDMLALMEGAVHATDVTDAGQTLVPYVTIIQATSNYVKRNHADYIETARIGDIINTLTLRMSAVRQLILCKFETHYTAWRPNNGPLVRQFFTASRPYNALPWRRNEAGEELKFGHKIMPDGNELVPSAVYYCLDYNPETGQSVASVLALTSTQFGKQRRLNSLTNMEMDGPNGPFIPPMFSRIYDCTTASETGGPNGDKEWSGWRFEPGMHTLTVPHGQRLFAKAKAFREAIEAGKVRPHPPQENLAEADGGATGTAPQPGTRTGPQGDVIDDDIPF